MSIDIKQLAKVIALCRKTGVSELEVEGIRLKLTHEPPQKRAKAKKEATLPTDSSYPTEEQIMFWSSAGHAGGN